MSTTKESPNMTPVEDNPFSAQDIKLIMVIFKNMKSCDVDFETIAKEYGFKSATVARKRYQQVKAKCTGGAVSKSTTPAKGSARVSEKKRKDMDLGGPETPSKRPTKKVALKKEDSVEELKTGDEEEVDLVKPSPKVKIEIEDNQNFGLDSF